VIALAFVSLGFAAVPALLYFRNAMIFRPPPVAGEPVSISVLIPARNEEASIAACVESVLSNRNAEIECIVLDDHSTDRTAAIVRAIAARDGRVRLATAAPPPTGWSGKQHACFELSKLARFPILTYLDADVRLAPDALSRMAAFRSATDAALVSGFPRQETGTILEKLVIPLMHFLLLGFLPFGRMRTTSRPGFGAGCGQWFLTTREAYDRVGGHMHPRVRGSFHDGLQLPRAYRECGWKTDLGDVTELAACRMYRTAGQVWNGLAKNAREGLAAPKLIVFSTTMLLCGQVLPFALLPFATGDARTIAIVASAAALLPRIDAVVRFRQSPLGAILHPVGVMALLAIQWYATARAVAGRPVGWKGRDKPGDSPI
jgi:Glycosyl transferase family 2